MKRIICFLFAILMLFLASCNGGGDDKGNENKPDPRMGDANGDGVVDALDVKALDDYLYENGKQIFFEFCDLNGDFKLDGEDIAILESYVNGENVNIEVLPFGKNDPDITSDLHELGVNGSSKWSGDDGKFVMSRNPYDMINVDGRILVSGGNYNDNTGPVQVNYYSLFYGSGISGTLMTEQVNKFYDIGDYVLALGIDPRAWQEGDVYFYSKAEQKWISKLGVLKDNIHCYDMIEFDGKYFFCGSNLEDKTVDGKWGEYSHAAIFVVDGELTPDLKSSDYNEVEVIDKNGNVISYESYIVWAGYNGTEYHYTAGVPRFHEFFTLGGELYALYYNQYYERYGEKYNLNGFYKYNPETEQFVFDESKNVEGIYPYFNGSAQDGEKIQHGFEFDGRAYFVNAGLASTSDFVTYTEEKITGFEGYVVRDVLFRGKTAYVLACEQQSDGSYVNAVFETTDFKNYKRLLHFDAPLFARSFEFADGCFYFGLGITLEYNDKWIPAENQEYCGTIYRYEYYKQ